MINIKKKISKKVSKILLETKSIKLNFKKQFTWASSIKSPIYCNNRNLLLYPKSRDLIVKYFAKIIKKKYPSVNMIAGVATGGISYGVLIAKYLNLPFVYVRAKAKEHGLKNLVEGEIKNSDRILVIEDLISTGSSSLNAVESLRNSGGNVIGLGAIFTYGFKKSIDNFKNANCDFFTLTNFETTLKVSQKENYINNEEIKAINEWYEGLF